jgi:transcriptional regulator with XRE-family HTH domain
MKKKIFELRSLIYGKFDSETAFAEHLGWTRQRLNKITTGQKEPSVTEVHIIAEGLGIDVSVIFQIFLHFWSPDRQRNTA